LGKNRVAGGSQDVIAAEYEAKKTEVCKDLITAGSRKFLGNDTICIHFKAGGMCQFKIKNITLNCHNLDSGGCVGGFGAPVQIKYSNRWFLRGVYSAAIRSSIEGCKSNGIISVTDTARSVKFITKSAGLTLKNVPTDEDVRKKSNIFSKI
jgi:hypothetical protein